MICDCEGEGRWGGGEEGRRGGGEEVGKWERKWEMKRGFDGGGDGERGMEEMYASVESAYGILSPPPPPPLPPPFQKHKTHNSDAR